MQQFDMRQLIARPHLRAAVSDSLQEAPVVALLGARQVGKTTLAQQVAAAWPGRSRFLDLEVAAVREALVRTPDAVLRSSDGLVVVDEVQRLPALFEVLRPICDDPDRRAVFLLLGSASLDLIRGVSETLAGRILFVDVSGFSISEVGAEHQQRLWMRVRISARLARLVVAGMDAMDAVLHPDVPGAGHTLAWGHAFHRRQSGDSGECSPTATAKSGTRPRLRGRWTSA